MQRFEQIVRNESVNDGSSSSPVGHAASLAIAAGSPGSATGVSTSPADDPKQKPGSPSNCSYPGGSCREDETKATDGA